MQGDLELTNLDTPKSTAGIVPRVLHSLFNILESQADAEYSVKCSYVELYNEELRDLLAPEYRGEQSGTGGLKLYEDGKKGTMIQGLEETGVRNLKEALGMLDKGVKRRQTAETKMNTESSYVKSYSKRPTVNSSAGDHIQSSLSQSMSKRAECKGEARICFESESLI